MKTRQIFYIIFWNLLKSTVVLWWNNSSVFNVWIFNGKYKKQGNDGIEPSTFWLTANCSTTELITLFYNQTIKQKCSV